MRTLKQYRQRKPTAIACCVKWQGSSEGQQKLDRKIKVTARCQYELAQTFALVDDLSEYNNWKKLSDTAIRLAG